MHNSPTINRTRLISHRS